MHVDVVPLGVRECDGTGTTQGGRDMSNDLKVVLLSVGGFSQSRVRAVGVGRGLTWLD